MAKAKTKITPYRARVLIARILADLEGLVMPPADIARQSRRLRDLIEVATGNPLPAVTVDREESYGNPPLCECPDCGSINVNKISRGGDEPTFRTCLACGHEWQS